MSSQDPSTIGYRQMGRGQPDQASGVEGRPLRLLGLGTVALVLVLLITFLVWPGDSPAPRSGTGFLAASHGQKASPASHVCNCPPSEAVWRCSEEQYRALMNGTTCAYYATAGSGNCQACLRAKASLDCRACRLGLLRQDFCEQCSSQGLSDVGCKGCGEPAAALLGGDADEHGCRASAGYSWCEASSSCVRPWELGLLTQEAFEAKCVPAASRKLQAAEDVDLKGCHHSAGYRWCEAKGECIGIGEEGMRTEQDFNARCEKKKELPLPGGGRDEHGCLPSAGYCWCEAMSQCIRPWEHGIHGKSDFEARCSAESGAKVYP